MEYRTTDVSPFSVRVILLLVAGIAFCSLTTRQTKALVHVFLWWNSMPRMLLAAIFLSLCCFHYPAGSAMPQTTVFNQKFSCAPPRLDQPYSKALQGLLHFFQQQREQTLVTSCCWDFLDSFWATRSPICICLAACIKRCTHSLSTDFLPLMDAQHKGWWGWEMSFGVWGLRSEFSKSEFTRHPHQTVVFLRFKYDSSSDSSPFIQNKYDSRVFKLGY